MEIRKTLARQMEEKRKQRADEQLHNKKYVQMVIDADSKHKQDEANKAKEQARKLKEIQRFQRVQMGELPDSGDEEGSAAKAKSKSL